MRRAPIGAPSAIPFLLVVMHLKFLSVFALPAGVIASELAILEGIGSFRTERERGGPKRRDPREKRARSPEPNRRELRRRLGGSVGREKNEK